MDKQKENLERAAQLAEKILSMDYFSAQLRLVHAAALRDGDFDAERLRTIVGHLQQVADIAAALVPHVAALTPTQPAEVPAEKETTP